MSSAAYGLVRDRERLLQTGPYTKTGAVGLALTSGSTPSAPAAPTFAQGSFFPAAPTLGPTSQTLAAYNVGHPDVLDQQLISGGWAPSSHAHTMQPLSPHAPPGQAMFAQGVCATTVSQGALCQAVASQSIPALKTAMQDVRPHIAAVAPAHTACEANTPVMTPQALELQALLAQTKPVSVPQANGSQAFQQAGSGAADPRCDDPTSSQGTGPGVGTVTAAGMLSSPEDQMKAFQQSAAAQLAAVGIAAGASQLAMGTSVQQSQQVAQQQQLAMLQMMSMGMGVGMGIGLGIAGVPSMTGTATGMSGLPGMAGMGGMAGAAGMAGLAGLGPGMAGMAATHGMGRAASSTLGAVASTPASPAWGSGVPSSVVRKAKPKVASATAALPALTPEELAEPNCLLEAAGKRDEQRCRAIVASASFKFVNRKNAEGRTAIHVAMLKKLPQDLCVAMLKRSDFTEVNCVDGFGYTLLILGASKGMSELCKAVLEREDFTLVNAKDKWGATALHWAADQDLADVCEAILRNPGFCEANRRAFSFAFEDKTALDVADHRNCRSAAEAIRKHLESSW